MPEDYQVYPQASSPLGEDSLYEIAKKYNPDPMLQAAIAANTQQASPYWGMRGAPYQTSPSNIRFPFSQAVDGVSGIPFVEGEGGAGGKSKVPGQNPLSPQAMALLNSMMPVPSKPQYIGGAAPRPGPTNIQMVPVMNTVGAGTSAPPGLNVDIPSLAALINGTAYKR